MARRVDNGDIAPSRRIAFESMEALLKALTPNRWASASPLAALRPFVGSRLSSALGRDYRGVHADVAGLLGLGLIERGRRRLGDGAVGAHHRGNVAR